MTRRRTRGGSLAAWSWPFALGVAIGLPGCSAAEHGSFAPAGHESTVDGGMTSRPKVRVLVTGFHDWRDLGQPPDLWRCRDNPSCRLLVGEPTVGREPVSADFDGPLVSALRGKASADVTYDFDTLPVTWGAYDLLGDLGRYDVVVHLGLGVYDTTEAIQVEHGAFNSRRGTDAAGSDRAEPISEMHPDRIDANHHVEARIAAIAGRRHGAYVTRVGEARPENSFLCNETHFRALQSLASAGGTLEAAYFVHIPSVMADDPSHERLADGVAGVIRALVE